MTVRRTQVSVNAAIRQIIAVPPQKRAFINQFAARSAAFALSLAGCGNALRDIILLESPKVETANFTQYLAQKSSSCLMSVIPITQCRIHIEQNRRP